MESHIRTHPWIVLSVRTGNLIQVGGLLVAAALFWRARRPDARNRTSLLIASWLLAYLHGHALAHWIVGRLGGIRFEGYGVHGTGNPGSYPPGVRWIFTHLPFHSARTQVASRRAASPGARAAMYAAGTLATIGTSLGLPIAARQAGIPGATGLLRFASVWIAGMLIGERAPQSDVRRAWRSLRA